MKAGFVMAESPKPKMNTSGIMPDSDTISKMSWEDINKMMERLGA